MTVTCISFFSHRVIDEKREHVRGDQLVVAVGRVCILLRNNAFKNYCNSSRLVSRDTFFLLSTIRKYVKRLNENCLKLWKNFKYEKEKKEIKLNKTSLMLKLETRKKYFHALSWASSGSAPRICKSLNLNETTEWCWEDRAREAIRVTTAMCCCAGRQIVFSPWKTLSMLRSVREESSGMWESLR